MRKGLNNIGLATGVTPRRRDGIHILMANPPNCSNLQRYDYLLVLVLRSSFAELERVQLGALLDST